MIEQWTVQLGRLVQEFTLDQRTDDDTAVIVTSRSLQCEFVYTRGTWKTLSVARHPILTTVLRCIFYAPENAKTVSGRTITISLLRQGECHCKTNIGGIYELLRSRGEVDPLLLPDLEALDQDQYSEHVQEIASCSPGSVPAAF